MTQNLVTYESYIYSFFNYDEVYLEIIPEHSPPKANWSRNTFSHMVLHNN